MILQGREKGRDDLLFLRKITKLLIHNESDLYDFGLELGFLRPQITQIRTDNPKSIEMAAWLLARYWWEGGLESFDEKARKILHILPNLGLSNLHGQIEELLEKHAKRASNLKVTIPDDIRNKLNGITKLLVCKNGDLLNLGIHLGFKWEDVGQFKKDSSLLEAGECLLCNWWSQPGEYDDKCNALIQAAHVMEKYELMDMVRQMLGDSNSLKVVDFETGEHGKDTDGDTGSLHLAQANIETEYTCNYRELRHKQHHRRQSQTEELKSMGTDSGNCSLGSSPRISSVDYLVEFMQLPGILESQEVFEHAPEGVGSRKMSGELSGVMKLNLLSDKNREEMKSDNVSGQLSEVSNSDGVSVKLSKVEPPGMLRKPSEVADLNSPAKGPQSKNNRHDKNYGTKNLPSLQKIILQP